MFKTLWPIWLLSLFLGGMGADIVWRESVRDPTHPYIYLGILAMYMAGLAFVASFFIWFGEIKRK